MHRRNLWNWIAAAVVAVCAIGLASEAGALQVIVQGTTDPQLQATINITSLTNTQIVFSVTNVLVAGVWSSITGIGFELPGTVSANTTGVCGGSCGNFTATPTVSPNQVNIPQFSSAVLDWALITGSSFAGGNPAGVNQGQTATFTVTGNFSGLTQQQFLAGLYVRFQSIFDPNVPRVGSDVAHYAYNPYNPTASVPEPASILVLGTGLAGLTIGVRRKLRRRRSSLTSSAR